MYKTTIHNYSNLQIHGDGSYPCLNFPSSDNLQGVPKTWEFGDDFDFVIN